jgi:hypothetical protein
MEKNYERKDVSHEEKMENTELGQFSRSTTEVTKTRGNTLHKLENGEKISHGTL